jgi:hypothetical protein
MSDTPGGGLTVTLQFPAPPGQRPASSSGVLSAASSDD